MFLLDFIKKARPFSFFVGFCTGIVSMIYLLLHNGQPNMTSLVYITFMLSTFLLSNVLAFGSFFAVEVFMKKTKKSM